MATAVYEQVRADIISGRFKPGQALIELELAAQYGISRTPVREALQRLETEQFVKRGVRGFEVKSFTPEEILDIYDVRITLEVAAARGAATRRTELDLARLHSAHQSMTALVNPKVKARVEANRVFHEALWRASHSPTLLDLLIRLNSHIIRYPSSTLTVGDRWAKVLVEHEMLLGAIVERDAERAARIAKDHMTGSREVRLGMYADAN
jgi:DNA-binding GntR family transcriptional regulator